MQQGCGGKVEPKKKERKQSWQARRNHTALFKQILFYALGQVTARQCCSLLCYDFSWTWGLQCVCALL